MLEYLWVPGPLQVGFTETTANNRNTDDSKLPTSQAPDSNMEKRNKNKNIMGEMKYYFQSLMSG